MRRARLTPLLFALVALPSCAPVPSTLPSPSPATPVQPQATEPPTSSPVAPPQVAAPPSPVAPLHVAADSSPVATPTLPPVPAVDGPLAIHVVYPPRNHQLPPLDSNFILGSTGTGKATLTINGTPVSVYPNGAFLAWLPVPRPPSAQYELRATRGSDSASALVPLAVRPPTLALPDTGKLTVDRESISPSLSSHLALRGDERVRVSIRAPANARVTVRTEAGAIRPLTRTNGATWSADLTARDLEHPATILATRNGDSLATETGVVDLVDALPRRWAELIDTLTPARSDTDQFVILRPTPGGTYRWFLLPGTALEITGRRGDFARVRLDDQLEAWIERKDFRLLPEGAGVPRRTASNARVVARGDYSELRVPVTERPAYQVDERRDALVLTLYNTTSNVDVVNFATNDDVIRDVTWEQAATDRARFTVHLRRAPYGYLALWERGTFVLRVRRAPAVDPARPLAGRVIALDPGHPPIGSTGPTGLYEGDVVLEVAEQLKPMLEERGAIVVMTRSTRAPVPLTERPVTARRANAEVFVSIHLNALPDGANPLRISGTGTYFFHDHSEPLARAVQRGLVAQMGLRDLGINYDNLAVVRTTWMPAVLCEGAFVIVPEQEAALRDPGFQRRYARGILLGLEEFFRGVAGEASK